MLVWAGLLAYFDIRSRRLPNWLTLGAWVVGGLLLVTHQRSWMSGTWSSALLGAGFGALVTLPAYMIRKLGAGDVKMLVGIGLLTSLAFTVTCFVFAAIVGGLLALLWLLLDRSRHLLELLPPTLPAGLHTWLLTPLEARKMPYGALFALGVVVALWQQFVR